MIIIIIKSNTTATGIGSSASRASLLSVFYATLRAIRAHHMSTAGTIVTLGRDSVIASTLTAIPLGYGVWVLGVIRAR